MILFGIAFVRKDPAEHRTVVHVSAGKRAVDRGVHRAGRIAALERAEGKVVIPGDHAELTVALIQIIVVDHGAGVAVAVANEVVHNKVAKHLVHIQHAFQIFIGPELFQRGDQARFVTFVHRGFGTVKDVGIAVRVVVDIFQFHVVAAHAAESAEAEAFAAAFFGGVPVGGTAVFGLRIGCRLFGALPAEVEAVGHLAEIKAFGQILAVRHSARELTAEVKAFGHVFAARHLAREAAAEIRHFRHILTAWHLSAEGEAPARGSVVRLAFLRLRGRLLSLRFAAFVALAAVKIQVVHVEVLAVAAAAAEAQAVRLIQLAEVGAVVSGQKAVFHALNRQIQPPVLTVHREINEGAERTVRAEIVHHQVNQVILHHGVVLNQIIETELVKAVQRARVVKMIELQFEAVALAAGGPHGRKRRVALCANSGVGVLGSVHHHGAGGVFFVFAAFQKAVPVVHHNVDLMHVGRIEQRFFIFHSFAQHRKAEGPRTHEQDGENKDNGNSGNTDFINMLAC